jgi:hypothetical protein
MGKRTGLLVAAIAAGACWLALPAQAGAAITHGDYIVVDGTHAGVELHVPFNSNAPQGFVPKEDNKASGARGFIREPNDHCPYLHFEGVIEGKRIKETDCLRVVVSTYAQPFLIEMAAAIKKEEKDKPKAGVKHLQSALDELEAAQKAGKVSGKLFNELEFGIKEANRLDEKAEKELKQGGGDDNGEKELRKAINLKEEVVAAATEELKLLQPPKLKPLDAVFQPGASQTVYTENATDPDGRRLTYQWGLVELNDPTCINFEPTTAGGQNFAIWHHGDTQGCNHGLEGSNGHQGVVAVVVTDERFTCAASYFGSNTGTGPAPTPCQPLH